MAPLPDRAGESQGHRCLRPIFLRGEVEGEGETIWPSEEIETSVAIQQFTLGILKLESKHVVVLNEASRFPEPHRCTFFDSGGLGDRAGAGGVVFPFVLDADLKVRLGELGEFVRFMVQRGLIGRLIWNSSELSFGEISEVESEAILAGFDSENVLALIVGIFSPAILPTAEGVSGSNQPVGKEGQKQEDLRESREFCHWAVLPDLILEIQRRNFKDFDSPPCLLRIKIEYYG